MRRRAVTLASVAVALIVARQLALALLLCFAIYDLPPWVQSLLLEHCPAPTAAAGSRLNIESTGVVIYQAADAAFAPLLAATAAAHGRYAAMHNYTLRQRIGTESAEQHGYVNLNRAWALAEAAEAGKADWFVYLDADVFIHNRSRSVAELVAAAGAADAALTFCHAGGWTHAGLASWNVNDGAFIANLRHKQMLPLARAWRLLARWEAWRNTHGAVLALRNALGKPGRSWVSSQRLLHVVLQQAGTGFRTLQRYDGSCEFNYDGSWAVHAVDVQRGASGVEGKLNELRRAVARARGVPQTGNELD